MLACALVALVLASCTPARREIRGDAVRRIRFEGNGTFFSGHSDLQLRRQLVQQQSPPLTFTFPFNYFNRPVPLVPANLDTDGRRLEVWYAHQGWFDARFLGWELRRVRRQTERLAGVVDLIGHVVPGPVSFYRDLLLAGEWTRAADPVIRSAWLRGGIDPGNQFSLDAVRAASNIVVEALQDNTYAYADAEPIIDAFPEQQAVDVTIDVSPGISARFGEVTVEGLRRLDETTVFWRLGFRQGQAYSLRALRQARSDLYRTELFSVVDLEPDLSDPTRVDVPVRVTVGEAPFRRFRVLGGVFYNYYTVGPNVTLEFRDLHLFGTRWQMDARAGVGALIGVIQEDINRGTATLITGLGELRFEYPWFARGRLGLEFGGTFRQDAQFGTLPFRSLDANVLLAYRWSRWTTFSGGPFFQYFEYCSFERGPACLEPPRATQELAQLRFGGDFTDTSYRLFGLDFRLRTDLRDDPLRTRRGSFWGLDVRQSIPIPGFQTDDETGQLTRGFLYTRVEGDVRAWWPVRWRRGQRRFPFVVAGRVHAIGLVPWRGSDDPLPYPDLAFLGGPTSLRSYRTNQLGPYDAVCIYPQGRPNPPHNNGEPYPVDLTYLPRGGAVGLEGVGEVRYDFDSGISVAAWGELGLLSQRWRTVSAGDLRAGGGVGLRYYSPIGPVRLDVGLRPVYPEDLSAQRYIGCNPIDRLPRGFDILTASRGVREALDQRTFPLAINVFLAIGEPF